MVENFQNFSIIKENPSFVVEVPIMSLFLRMENG